MLRRGWWALPTHYRVCISLDSTELRLLTLKGRWLEASGFMTGMPITVTVERGRIETEINL
ncbi:type I toxin-antitoxin system SymE family toxin [Pectobacterium zantedeschiae]|uniref:Type I toxin-antitoxin system SymE family toxin n=1 Tax=Pectobacterium zantedeschiae TaxID=2034769 RepID=A0A9X8JFU8_9GAMM|nr:type I toxin-antitoxin system SymE family toxin [Pectobacterium zantedeschiae]